MNIRKRILKHPSEPHPRFSGSTGHIGELYRDDTTRIWEDGKHCYITVWGHRYKQTWTMDYDLKAISYLIALIKNGNKIKSSGGSNQGDIKKLVYKCYFPHKELAENVMLCNRDASDLSSSNLYVTGDIVPATTIRRIWHDNHRIYIKRVCSDNLFYTDYDYLLYTLLCDTRLKNWYVLKKGNAKRLYCHNPEGTTPIGFAEIVWLYHKGVLNPDDLIQSIIAGKKKLADKGLQIDHLQDNQDNNCIHNLAAMTPTENSKKSNLVSKIKLPYICVPVQKNGKFRVVCGKMEGEQARIISILCSNASDLVDCIQQFWKLASGKKVMSNISMIDWLQDDGRHSHGDTENLIEFLLRVDEKDLTKWPCSLASAFG